MVKVRKDLTGQKFGSLKVICQTDDLIQNNGQRKAMWRCKCDCGNEIDVRGDSLKNKSNKSCGKCKKYNDLTGMSFGRITVLRYIETDLKTRNSLWECKCKCGNVFIVKGVQLTRTRGMITCNKCHVVDGKNDIPTFAPWMEKCFKNKEDIYKYTYGSGKKILVKCPDCGKEKYVTVKHLYDHKSIGCVCSDNISYPEKFMTSILIQLKVVFTYQYSPKWIKPLRYDFYIPNKNLIIEVDGGIGHGNRWTFNSDLTSEELYQRDRCKDDEAKKHGINIIRINAYPSDFNILKNETKDKLSNYFDINMIDFNLCHEFGLTNLAKNVCEKWNDLKDVKKLSNIFKLSKPTIRKYLKNGSRIGWCDYNANEEKQKNTLRHAKRIKVYKSKQFIGEYESCAEFARQYNKMQSEIHINPVSLANMIKINNLYKGLFIEEV